MYRLLTRSLNHNFELQLLGGISTGITGEVLKDSHITGNPVADVLVKILCPIITGIAIPLVKNYIDERRRKRRK